ncbi:response regulator [Argonema antarcticum]|uniref:response regulator n=1 Tax=Argonema antarcticum TaxID=2942763 RepID=UPI002012FE33|nr:response regulator [Argonema antarcticum]MCL1473549.1 response regulator [Argonema antarcticum A004/B2]
MRILLVEDDEAMAAVVTDLLTKQHYVIDIAHDGEAGWEFIEAYTYDLILLDVVLPKMDGMTLCRRIRSHGYRMPVLLLTARQNSTDKVMGLDVGADDYVVKPFDLKELVARIRALLRRGNSALAPVLQWGKLHLDPSTCEVIYEDRILHLSPKEYSLLELFLRNNRRVFSRSAILEHLWSWEDAPGEDTVKAHIKGLRQKFKLVGVPSDLIETVYGMGYRLKPLSSEEQKENIPLILAAGFSNELTLWLQKRLAKPIQTTPNSEKTFDELNRGNWSLLLLDQSAIDQSVAKLLEEAYCRLKQGKQSIIYCLDNNLSNNLPRKLIGQILFHPLDWEKLAGIVAESIGLSLPPATSLPISNSKAQIEEKVQEISNVNLEIINRQEKPSFVGEAKYQSVESEKITFDGQESNISHIKLPILEGKTLNKSAELASIQSAVAGIWEKFKDKIINRFAAIERANTALLAGTFNDELRQKAVSEAHKLAGSLGTFGFAEGSSLARKIEELLQIGDRESSIGYGESYQFRSDDFKFSIVNSPNRSVLFSELVAALRRELETASATKPSASLSASATPRLLKNKQPKILIVEDDKELAEQLVMEAVYWGMQAESLSNLSAAKVTIQNAEPDLVLLDLSSGSPTEDGLILVRELSAQNPPVPIIVLTYRDTFSDRIEVARMGGCYFLRKPIEPALVMKAVSQVLQQGHSANFKVMAVDDDPEILTTLETLLQPEGLKLILLEDSRRLWEVLEATAPDFLVLDIDMPHVNGIELCKVIRNDPKWNYLPVLFLSSHTDAETIQRVFGVGADDYVQKPIAGPELVTRIFNRLQRVRVLRNISETDILTGVVNRHKSMQDLERFMRMSTRYKQPLCFTVLDFDYFQRVNEEYGDGVGDVVLHEFGKLLLQGFRTEDVVARWGGDEFAIGMYGITKPAAAKRLEELLDSLGKVKFDRPEGTEIEVTFSAGVVQYPDDGADLQSLYHNARKALDRAKAAGGDRIICFD